MSVNAFPSRQTSRLQNSSKPSISNGSGWAFGLPGTSGAGGGLGSNIGGTGTFGSTAARPAQLSGFAQVMGGGGSSSIDMSDFPSLSGGPQTPSAATTSTWNGGILRTQSQQRLGQTTTQRVPSAAPSQQSVEQAASPPEQETGDDFPPLGGQNGDGFARSPEGARTALNGQRGVLPYREPSSTTGQFSTTSNVSSTATITPRNAALATKRYADMTESEKYGLEGLAAAYEARKALDAGQTVDETLPGVMRSGLYFGQDLNALGMDLDSPDPIWPTFTAFPASTSQAQGAGVPNGMFDFHDRAIIPEFGLPPAYTVNNVPPLSSRLGSLSDETLFCIFYQNPRDILQEQAAAELTNRDWRWHKVLRQWLQKDSQHSAASNNSTTGGTNSSLPLLDLTQGIPVGTPAQRVNAGVERGVYVFFDVMNWRRERREFLLAYDELDQLFTPELGVNGAAGAGSGLSLAASALNRDGITA